MLSYFHRGGTQPLLGCTLDAYVKQVVERFADREALVSVHQNVRLTHGQFDTAVQRLARGFLALGIGRGDRVGIWATDTVEWVLTQFATARIGAVLVNVNPAYRPDEFEYAMRHAKIRTLVLMPEFRHSHYVEMVRELCPETAECEPGELRAERLPDLRTLVLFDPEADTVERPARAFMTWDELLQRGRRVLDSAVTERSTELDPDDPINIQFTSGTTGDPKAAVLTHHNILNNGFSVAEIMGLTENDRLCVPVPFYHCFGMVVANIACLTHGACVVIPAAHFNAGITLETIERERCTALHGVPSMFVAELECENFSRFDLSSLRTGIMAGAPCPPDLVRQVIERMGCREILIGYGMTEASPVTHCTRRDDSFERRTQTVGTNLPHQEVKVVDPETGRILPIGEQGEICFRGPHVMRGYLDEAATRETIDAGGWLHSGDLGILDNHGYMRITGRLKDMIIRGGENIYPAEIENVLFGHPAVAEVAVVGVEDERLGEEVAAWIKLHEGQHVEIEALREYAAERLAHFKVPRMFRIVDGFPLTVTGKVQKFRLREMAAEAYA